MHLYTDMVESTPFGPEENRTGSRSVEIITPSGNGVPRPSPKSAYWLAAGKGRYDEIRYLYTGQLIFTWTVFDDGSDSRRRREQDQRFRRVNNDVDIKALLSTSPAVSQLRSPLSSSPSERLPPERLPPSEFEAGFEPICEETRSGCLLGLRPGSRAIIALALYHTCKPTLFL